GTITNQGTMSVTGNATLNQTILNSGSLTKSSSGVTTFAAAFTNNGSTSVNAGTLRLTGTFSNYTQSTDVLLGGTYSVAGILRFTGADIVTNQATIVLNGATAAIRDTGGLDAFRDFTTNSPTGSLTVTNGQTLTLPKALTSSGTLVVGTGATL